MCCRVPASTKLRELEPLSLDGARDRFGKRITDEELLLRLTMPAEQVDAMVAARGQLARAGGAAGTGAVGDASAGARARALRSPRSRCTRTARAWSGAVLDGSPR